MQLSYLLMEKLEASSEIINQTRPVTNQSSYPSVLHPPELDPGLMSVYRDVTIPVNIAILVTSVLGVLGVCRDCAALLPPWMLAFSVGIISEASVFLYLISGGKASFSPVPAFILTIDFVLLLIQILFLVKVYNTYLKMKQGLRIGGTQLKNLEQGGLVEESSEIASARVSSIYRKSFCRKTHKNINLNKCKKLTSLSKISEEDSDNTQSKSDNQKYDEGLRKIRDKEMFSDKAATSSTSDNNSSSNDGTEMSQERPGHAGPKTETGAVSRFIPEIMTRYRVTIV